MKELSNSYQDKKGFWKKATAIAGGFVLLTACEQSHITEGTIYQKEYTKTEKALLIAPKALLPLGRVEIDKEGSSASHQYEEIGQESEVVQRGLHYHKWENWKVYIAQCPTKELPPQEKIEKECKTNSFVVSKEVYNSIQIGQQTNFKQSE